ncbi:MAG TPA: TRAP transporter large permease subunit, partial [Aminobacteriaceae bacterium]|nr:TRAP transporter large permease subunit [Aminobacteriaceae bacterium]
GSVWRASSTGSADSNFFNYFRNSFVVVVVSLTMILLLGSLCAYALAHWRTRISGAIYFAIIIGMIMDDVSAMLLCTPILLPVVVSLGIHPIHFAAIIGTNLGLGNVTPPTAPTLYFGGRMAKTPVSQMMKPAMIFILFAWLPTLLAVTFLPELALWLPRLVLGGRL